MRSLRTPTRSHALTLSWGLYKRKRNTVPDGGCSKYKCEPGTVPFTKPSPSNTRCRVANEMESFFIGDHTLRLRHDLIAIPLESADRERVEHVGCGNAY